MAAPQRVRCALTICGTVQGVGFRPAVYRLARACALVGFVRNESGGVRLEIEGEPHRVTAFREALADALPEAARIERMTSASLPPQHDEDFCIAPSAPAGDAYAATLPPDRAPCDACTWELQSPGGRRYGYPFISCTQCGPRYSVLQRLPYDRANTTMAPFTLCAACRREYEDPTQRRFHAEINACPTCGPTAHWRAAGGEVRQGAAAVAAAVASLANGGVVAVKGVGGYLLACDATQSAAVRRLRERKQRPHKPLAVMAANMADLDALVRIEPVAREALCDRARPVVLLPRRSNTPVADNVAPDLDELGVFLPPSPLQQLLFDGGLRYLVMTSANVSGAPIVAADDAANAMLNDCADAILAHNRRIYVRLDDSVVRPMAGKTLCLRRGRGTVPQAFSLPHGGSPVLAVGAELKSAVCLTRGAEGFLSQHLGALANPEAHSVFTASIRHLENLLGVTPHIVAHDQHPDYRSSAWAEASGLPCMAVQHHHAHVAACMSEHRHWEPVLGVVFDGTGYGPDGSSWGGEFLSVGLHGFARLGHLSPLQLLGGEAAVREPWRLALAALAQAGEPVDLIGSVQRGRQREVVQLLDNPRLAPLACGAGRWFDAVAALCGLRSTCSYEGQAAMELEAAALPGVYSAYVFALEPTEAGFVIDLAPALSELVGDLRRETSVGVVAARFHETMAQSILAGCRRSRASGAPETVVLSGGCFQNRRLTERARELLAQEGLNVLVHGDVPCNDGGIALGQAVVANAILHDQPSAGTAS